MQHHFDKEIALVEDQLSNAQHESTSKNAVEYHSWNERDQLHEFIMAMVKPADN
jgi:hypothetical protein